MNTNKSINILLAEDSPSDQAIFQEAIRHSQLKNHLHVVDNGEQAVAFLKKEGDYAKVPTPDLILLDLNMPRKNGLEVLAELKENKRWQGIPVVVLTSSKADLDVASAYRLRVNAYVVKPLDFDKYVDVVRSIESFWFSIISAKSK